MDSKMVEFTHHNVTTHALLADKIYRSHEFCFALIADLSSGFQLGDLIKMGDFNDGKGFGTQFAEVKEGQRNGEILDAQFFRLRCG